MIYDVTLRIRDLDPENSDADLETWDWTDAVNGLYDTEFVKFIGFTEVHEWHFGDVVTKDHHPDVAFRVVTESGGVFTDCDISSYTYHLIWIEGGFTDEKEGR